MKKLKIGVVVSVLAFLVTMFFPSFQGVDTKVFGYTQMNYFELLKEKWWIYLLLSIILILTIISSIEKSRILSIIFATGFAFLNLSLLSLENGRLFINGYPMLWGYALVVLFGSLMSTMLVIYAYKNSE